MILFNISFEKGVFLDLKLIIIIIYLFFFPLKLHLTKMFAPRGHIHLYCCTFKNKIFTKKKSTKAL